MIAPTESKSFLERLEILVRKKSRGFLNRTIVLQAPDGDMVHIIFRTRDDRPLAFSIKDELAAVDCLDRALSAAQQWAVEWGIQNIKPLDTTPRRVRSPL